MSRYFTPSALQKVYLPDPDSTVAISLLQETSPPLRLSPFHRLEMELALKSSSKALKHWHEDVARGLYEFADLSLSVLVNRVGELGYSSPAASDDEGVLNWLHVAAALEMGCSEWVDFEQATRSAATNAGLRVLPTNSNDSVL